MVSIIEIGKTWCSASGKLLSSVELKEIPAPTSPSVCLLHYPPPHVYLFQKILPRSLVAGTSF